MTALRRLALAIGLAATLGGPALADGSPLILGKPGIDRLTGDCAAGPGQGSQAITCTKINGVDQTSAWTAYTPTLTCGSGTLTAAVATGHYKAIGKTIHVRITVTITTYGTCGTSINATLPVAPTGDGYSLAGWRANDNKGLATFMNASPMQIYLYDGTHPGGDGIILVVSGSYQSA